MNTRQYNYLLTIASCEGLSAAAKKLGVTQAALSKFLAEQERLLGVKLFLLPSEKNVPHSGRRNYAGSSQKHTG